MRNLVKRLVWLCLAVGALFILWGSDCHAQEAQTYRTEKGTLTYIRYATYGKYWITSYGGKDETLVIPGEISGCEITGIEEEVFSKEQ